MAEPPDFAEFRNLSAALGNDPLLVQGAGGNTSIKHKDAMWVKASGAWLRDAKTKNIFVAVEYKPGDADVKQPDFKRLDAANELRPSIEISLHAALPHRVIAHVHAVDAITLAVRENAANLCAQKLSGLDFAFVPYVKPGWDLTQGLRAKLQAQQPDIFILGNHGLIVGGNSVAKVQALINEVQQRLKTNPRPAPPADTAFLEKAAQGKWRLPKDRTTHSLVMDTVSLLHATGGTLYPDHVVFLGRGCHTVTENEIAATDPAKHRIILVKGKGVLLAKDLSPSGEEMAQALADITARIPPKAKLRYLTAAEEDALMEWDAEKYRQGMA